MVNIESVIVFELKWGEKMKIVLRLGRNWTIFVHLAYWKTLFVHDGPIRHFSIFQGTLLW